MLNKNSIHKRYKKIIIEMTDGTMFKTRSTYFNEKLKLEIDVKTHPAWLIKNYHVNTKINQFSKFQKKFGNLFI